MSWKDIKIAKKLYIGFGGLLVLTVAVGMVAVNGFSNVKMQVVNADDANRMVKWMKDCAVARRDLYISGEAKYAEAWKKTIASIDQQIDTTEAQLTRDETKAKLEEIRKALQEYRGEVNKYTDIVAELPEFDEKMIEAGRKTLAAAKEIGGLSGTQLEARTRQCRQAEKNYVLRGDKKYVDEIKQTVDLMLADLLTMRTGSGARASVEAATGGVQAYHAAFSQYYDAREKQQSTGKNLGVLNSKLVERMDDLRQELKKAMEGAQSLAVTMATTCVIAAVLIGMIAAFFIARGISRPVMMALVATEEMNRQFNDLEKVIEKIADNDLTVKIENSASERLKIVANDEIGQLAKALDGTLETKDKVYASIRKMAENLSGVIRQLTDNSTQLVSAATEIASSSEQMARGSQEQTGQTAQVSSAVEEMTATIVESSKNASEAAGQAKEAANAARSGNQVVTQTIEGMNRIAQVVQESANTVQELAKSSDKIGEIIGVIDDIADQTNLLALNAAIEAARAGEQGRGFAVVADEVRKLAERTGKATKEITDMIKGIQNDTKGAVAGMEQGINEVQQGRDLADKAGESLTAIATFSQKVMDMIQQIATAAEQQSAASEQIARSVEGIAKVTKENATGVEQSAAAAEELNRQAEGMQKMVSRFKVNA